MNDQRKPGYYCKGGIWDTFNTCRYKSPIGECRAPKDDECGYKYWRTDFTLPLDEEITVCGEK